MKYQLRAIDNQLDEMLQFSGAIAVEGVKGVGKTESAIRRSEHLLQLDRAGDRQLLEADPEFRSFSTDTILIDEWQRMPECWDFVRRGVDAQRTPGRFLLTGSATPQAGIDTHSGAGRILSIRMRPMALFERREHCATVSLADLFLGNAPISGTTDLTLNDYVSEIARSGFPGFNEQPQRAINVELDSYIERIVDRDLPEQGYNVRNRAGLLGWMRAYAAASSTTMSYSEILNATTPSESDKPARKTAALYRSKLTEIWMLDEVPAWDFVRSPLAGLAQAPKHQLADPAFVLRLLGVPANRLITERYRHFLGPLFESLATLSVRVAAESQFGSVRHLRTRRGDHEVDLIASNQDGDLVAIEVKLTADVKNDDVAHLHWLKEQLPDDVVDMVVLTTGNRAYRRSDGVAVVPLALFGA